MTFTDQELEQLKSILGHQDTGRFYRFEINNLLALLWRMQTAESILEVITYEDDGDIDALYGEWHKACGK
jgi:hypothetical protein